MQTLPVLLMRLVMIITRTITPSTSTTTITTPALLNV